MFNNFTLSDAIGYRFNQKQKEVEDTQHRKGQNDASEPAVPGRANATFISSSQNQNHSELEFEPDIYAQTT